MKLSQVPKLIPRRSLRCPHGLHVCHEIVRMYVWATDKMMYSHVSSVL